MRRTFALLLAVTVLSWGIGCNNDSASSSATSGTGPVNPASSAPGSSGTTTEPPSIAATPVSAEEFAKMMDADKTVYTARIEELKKKADGLTGDEQKKFKAKIDDIEERFNDSLSKYETMDKKDAHWGEVSGNMKLIWEGIKKEIDTELGIPPGTTAPEATGTAAATTESGTGSTEGTPPANNPPQP